MKKKLKINGKTYTVQERTFDDLLEVRRYGDHIVTLPAGTQLDDPDLAGIVAERIATARAASIDAGNWVARQVELGRAGLPKAARS